MDYRFRSKKDREIEEALRHLIDVGMMLPELQAPDSKPGDAVKFMKDETRKKLKDLKSVHCQHYYRKYPNKEYGVSNKK